MPSAQRSIRRDSDRTARADARCDARHCHQRYVARAARAEARQTPAIRRAYLGYHRRFRRGAYREDDAANEEFFRSLGLSTHLSQEGIGEATIAEIERRFNAAGSRFGEAHNVDGAMARRILEACL